MIWIRKNGIVRNPRTGEEQVESSAGAFSTFTLNIERARTDDDEF